MKKGLLSLVAVFLIAAGTLSAQTEKREKFFVAGNCGMCETRIEKTALAVDGVKEADWDKESRMLMVTFKGEKADIKAVQKAVAAAGHDTEAFRAETAVYDKLPACCKYERIKDKDSTKK